VVLCPARLVEVKGSSLLLEAWGSFTQGLNGELVLAGRVNSGHAGIAQWSLGLAGSVNPGCCSHDELLRSTQSPRLRRGSSSLTSAPVSMRYSRSSDLRP